MTTSHAAFGRTLGFLALTCLTPACAAVGHHTLVRTAAGEEMAFDRVPTRTTQPTSIAMPALAPCRLGGHGPDIVCALVTMDGTYYAAMRNRGDAKADAVADSFEEVHQTSASQVATDD